MQLPNSRFDLGQRVTTVDGESGVIYAIFYTLRESGYCWRMPGFTYFIDFDANSSGDRSFDDTAHESELEAQ